MDAVRAAKGEKKIPVARSKVAGTRAFRRVHSDRAAGLIGLFLVVVAGVLLFTWPQPPEKKEPAYNVDWPTETIQAFHDNITVVRGVVFQRDIEFALPNITRVELFINWQDDVGDEPLESDNATLQLVGPDTANLTLPITSHANTSAFSNETRAGVVAQIPSIRQVPARTLGEARATLGDHTTRNGTGTWTLRVTLPHVGDDFQNDRARNQLQNCPEQGIPQVCTYDPGNRLEVRVSYRTYRVALEPAAG